MASTSDVSYEQDGPKSLCSSPRQRQVSRQRSLIKRTNVDYDFWKNEMCAEPSYTDAGGLSLGGGHDYSDLRRRPSAPRLDAVLDPPPDRRPNRCSRAGSLAVLPGPHERALLDLLLVREQHLLMQAPTSRLPQPTLSLHSRRHSAHCCPSDHDDMPSQSLVPPQPPPPLPLRPPAVPERSKPGPPPPMSSMRYNAASLYQTLQTQAGISLQQQKPLQPPLPPPYVNKHPKLPQTLANNLNAPMSLKQKTMITEKMPTQLQSHQHQLQQKYQVAQQLLQQHQQQAHQQQLQHQYAQQQQQLQQQQQQQHQQQQHHQQQQQQHHQQQQNHQQQQHQFSQTLSKQSQIAYHHAMQLKQNIPSHGLNQLNQQQQHQMNQQHTKPLASVDHQTQPQQSMSMMHHHTSRSQNNSGSNSESSSPAHRLPQTAQYMTQQQQQQQQSHQQVQQQVQQPQPQPVPTTTQGGATPAVKMSVRQDSNVSSDSFSQNSSPSYTTKSMETPLLPHHASRSQGGQYPPHLAGGAGKASAAASGRPADCGGVVANNGNAALTKSISTPASLQTIVRFHNGSNMSLHHRIIRDMRRPSAHYITRGRLRFRFAQVLVNAVALLAIAGGLAAYFRAYHSNVRYVNKTVTTATIALNKPTEENPAPGICLPVIVSFCHYHKIPYNFTMFPNYMGHFTQRDAQQELEVYDVVVDVRCYELAALFLCSVFVPKCGPTGQLVRPCRSLCYETKRRCGFFLEVFGLTLPEYLDCGLFPESQDTDICVGHQEVIDAELRAQKPVCTSGFQCDLKRCIPSDWRCDGHVDCEDRTDELHCDTCSKEGLIHCGENRCMSQVHMCDGVVDCPWGQDERNCLRLSDRMGDEGRGRLEVFQPQHQSWQPACVTHWDPSSSAQGICSLLGYGAANSSGLTMRGSRVALSPSTGVSMSHSRKLHSHKQANILKDLRTCSGDDYPTVELTCSNYLCGKRRHPNYPRATHRIVGGFESTPGDWPFLAALLGGPEEIFYCAGVLIADQWVLTASHCVGNFSQSEPSGWTIQLGITRRHSHSYYGQKMKVRRVVPHPMYNLGVAHDNDVALFQLKTRVKFHEHLLPVCLPPPNHELVPGTPCTVIGWGKKEDKDASEYEPAVNEVVVPVLNRDLCNVWLEHRDLNVTEGMICAGYAEGGKDACQGDSGGPLLCQDEKQPDRWFVGGIVSWGIKCAHPHLPGVYAYVPRYVPWIRQQMALYSD